MKNEMNEWNFGESFPSLEIDMAYWQTLNLVQKGEYLKKLVFQEKDFGNRLKLINFILSTSAKVGKSFVKNTELKGYFDVLENSANFISILSAVGNICKSKQSHKTIKNNEIAKLMGLPNGNYISENKLDITSAMADAFIDMSDYSKGKYGLVVDNIIGDDDKKGNAPTASSDDKQPSVYKTIKITGTLDVDTKWGMIIKTSTLLLEEEDTTNTCTCKLYYANSGGKIHPDLLKDKLQKIMYALYIEKVDTTRNFVKIKGTKLEICERKEIEYDIVNIEVDRLVRGMRKVFDTGSRRGITFIGEPGTGKTICVHKITNEFRDKLVFWVSPDSINTVHGIRNTFKIFKMFEGSLIVFDDIDSGPFTAKDEVTGEFIAHLDGTNNKEFKGFIISTVNDPSKLHASYINRPERNDEVIHVKNPQTVEEIINIIFIKAELAGYHYREPVSDEVLVESDEVAESTVFDDDEYEDEGGIIDFDETNPEFITICERILAASFTQAQVAGLVSYCQTYSENNTITLDLLNESITNRLETIFNVNKVAVKGGKLTDSNAMSDEALANLSKKSRIS